MKTLKQIIRFTLHAIRYLWPLYYLPFNYKVSYFYYSFGATKPGIVGANYYTATSAANAIQQNKGWCNANHAKLHNPLYPGRYHQAAHYLPPHRRIKCKWFKKER